MRFNARIPVIPLPYSLYEEYRDKQGQIITVEKELVIDYGNGVDYPNLYIVDEYDNSKLWDITEGIRQSIQGSPGDDFTVEIEDIGIIKLGDVLNLLYTISLTHDEAWDIETIKKMIPTTIVDNKGIVYAPRTLSSNVFTASGESIDARLQAISKLGLAIGYVITEEDDQKTIKIPFPFNNYLQEGNSFWLSIGGTMVDERCYFITDSEGNHPEGQNLENGTHITFTDKENYVQKGRCCKFMFWYNSLTPDTGALLVMDGKYITPSSIETNRLAHTSDSIDLNAPDAVATARAVCTLRNVLNERIDALAGNASVTCMADESSTETDIVVKISDYILADSNMIHIRLTKDLAPNATLKVNDEGSKPIFNGNERVASGPKAGEIINVSYSKIDDRFYIYGVSTFKLETTISHVSPVEGTAVIPFNLTYNSLVDKFDVYYNGVKLFKDVNFTMNESSITLLDFVSEVGDLFTFEVTQIVPVKK